MRIWLSTRTPQMLETRRPFLISLQESLNIRADSFLCCPSEWDKEVSEKSIEQVENSPKCQIQFLEIGASLEM